MRIGREGTSPLTTAGENSIRTDSAGAAGLTVVAAGDSAAAGEAVAAVTAARAEAWVTGRRALAVGEARICGGGGRSSGEGQGGGSERLIRMAEAGGTSDTMPQQVPVSCISKDQRHWQGNTAVH